MELFSQLINDNHYPTRDLVRRLSLLKLLKVATIIISMVKNGVTGANYCLGGCLIMLVVRYLLTIMLYQPKILKHIMSCIS